MSSSKPVDSGTEARGERLQKFLSHAGVASRRASEELIRSGEVTINGRVAELGDRVSPDDAVKVGNKLIPRNESARLVIALNKPEGTITTSNDPEGRATVFDLVPPRWRTGLLAIGRLDYGTEGLLLLTNDGDLAQRVAHPRYGCRKTYRVKVRGEPDERSLDRLRRGLVLDGKRLQPATIEPHRLTMTSKQRRAQKNTWWTVEIGEGRTRQVRKMFERIGHPVSRLQRVAVGPIRLGRLAKGELRELDEAEIAALERSTGKQASAGPRKNTGRSGSGKKPSATGAKRGTKPQRRSEPSGGTSSKNVKKSRGKAKPKSGEGTSRSGSKGQAGPSRRPGTGSGRKGRPPGGSRGGRRS